MCFSFEPFKFRDSRFAAFSDRLRDLFAAMDREFTRAAAHYGFQCSGCPDNCCQTHFYHYTHLEYLFIQEGLAKLTPAKQRQIRIRAEDVCRKVARADREGHPLRMMCPLNDHGLCILYPNRPMICRLHGIPHEFQNPGQKRIHCPGCTPFDERCPDKPYYAFDRTPFYSKMASLEKEFKQTAGITGKIKLTIAEMITGKAQSSEVRGQRADGKIQVSSGESQKTEASEL
jgi:Fe-S-cluster containining protein